MKFRTAFLFLAVLLCAFLPALAEENPLLGDWQMTRYCAENIIYEDPAAVGSHKSILFSADGTAEVTINGTVYPATWTQEGVFVHLLYADGDRAEFIAEPDLLIYATGNQVQHFTKNTPEPTAVPVPAIVGTWSCRLANGTNTLQIMEDGQAVLSIARGNKYRCNWRLNGSSLELDQRGNIIRATYDGSSIKMTLGTIYLNFTR